jgi:hypothetical protein
MPSSTKPKSLPTKGQLITWSRNHQERINEIKQHLLDLAIADAKGIEQLKHLISDLVQASYALGGVHADLAEGRHS